jgi:hypothetical protein
MNQNSNIPDGLSIDDLDPVENECPGCGDDLGGRSFCRACAADANAIEDF